MRPGRADQEADLPVPDPRMSVPACRVIAQQLAHAFLRGAVGDNVKLSPRSRIMHRVPFKHIAVEDSRVARLHAQKYRAFGPCDVGNRAFFA
ncbi:hypothetical protein D3C87_1864680 [compost metagenome]